MSDKVSDERLIEFVVRWAWRDSPITDTERLSAIKYHPEIKRMAAEQGYAAARINSAIEPAAAADGYVVVPVEPTAAMIEAGVLDTKADVSFFDVEETYRAMLAARPISASGRDGE